MSKRQRDSLIAEVERHRQQQQQQQLQGDTQVALSYSTKNSQDRSPQLLQPMTTPYSYPGDTERLPYATDVLPYLECPPNDLQVSGMIYRGAGVSPPSRVQGRGDNSGLSDVRGEAQMWEHSSQCRVFSSHRHHSLCPPSFLSGFDSRQQSHHPMAIHPYNPLEDSYNYYPHSLRNIGEITVQWDEMCIQLYIHNIQLPFFSSSDELCTSIVRSHRETSQYRPEELQAFRWKLFSREEIQAYQSKVLPTGSLFHPPLFFLISLKLFLAWLRQSQNKTPFHMAWG